MKESEIQFENYDYVVFVDASGDDGFKFRATSGEGSSYTFVSSCFVVKPEDIQHNTKILQDMKKVLHLPENAELKSTTLKRHRLSDRAYALLDDLIGQCFSMIAFKKDLLKNTKYAALCDVQSKRLSGLTQAFPYYAIHQFEYFSPNDRILIVMDFMKKSEMTIVEEHLKNYGIDPAVSSNYDLIFRDSKAEKYSLIQIADVMAGVIREYFETKLIKTALQFHCKICKHRQQCSSSKVRKLLASEKIDKKYITPILMHRSPKVKAIMFAGIITFPFLNYQYFGYIDCKLRNKKRS